MAEESKIDLKKVHKRLYSGSPGKCVLVDVPQFNILRIDGAGDPNTSRHFSDAISALYSTAYTLKFMLKGREGLPDYSVMPLEALWWVADTERFSMDEKNEWMWRAFIVHPEHVTPPMVEEALVEARRKKDLATLAEVRFEPFDEGSSAQVMHIGPWSEERPTIERLHAFIAKQGLTLRGKHHEIYLSDPNRTAPEKLKTIVRQPVAGQ